MAERQLGVHDGAVGNRLSGLDAMFLYVETDAMPMHVALTAVLDPSTVPGGYTFEKMRTFIGERIPMVAELHRRVVEVPLRLAHPVWVDDVDYRVEHHVHRVVLDPPGEERQLAAFVAEMAGRRLARDRPLWEFWIVEGLAEGRIALAGKVHHCALDGRAAADLMPAFFGISPDPEPVVPADVEPALRPDDLTMVTSAVRDRARSLPGSVGAVARLARGTRSIASRRNGGDSAGATPLVCPPTPYNGSITAARSIAFGRLRLDDVKTVGRAAGATVNDVLLTICARALRAHLQAADALPESPLVAAVPVSVRPDPPADGNGTGNGTGNMISTMFVPLHCEIDEPAAALRATARDSAAAKAEHAIVGGDTALRLAELADPLAMPFFVQLYSRAALADRHRPAVNAIVSNVVGPPIPIYLGGARAEALYPMGPVVEGVGLNLTVMSYDGHVDLGLLTAAALVPDPSEITALLPSALAEVAAAVGATLATP